MYVYVCVGSVGGQLFAVYVANGRLAALAPGSGCPGVGQQQGINFMQYTRNTHRWKKWSLGTAIVLGLPSIT